MGRSTTEHWRKRNDKRTLTGRPWRRLRERILKRDQYLCVACRAKGRLTEATEVDHIKPVAQDGSDAEENLQSLCAPCHQAKTAIESGGFSRAITHPEWLPTPACPVVLVTGPPGAGKTTYCRQSAAPADAVIDLDECFLAVCGVHGHEADRKHLSAAIRYRNHLIAGLAGKRSGKAFLIVSAPTAKECGWWIDKLQASHILIDPGMSVCLGRLPPERRPLARKWYDEARRGEWSHPSSRRIIGIDGWPVES